MDRTIKHEMAITHKEFFRLLPAAVRNLNYEVRDNIIAINDGSRCTKIELEHESRRTIASLSLPVTRLSISFKGCSDIEIKSFLRHFDLVYRKGGG